ncbi:hypothetical protein ABZP36_003694 [Zizania latifolia]
MAPPLLLVLFLLPAFAAGHQNPSTYGSSALSEWRSAKASYYATDPEDAIGGMKRFLFPHVPPTKFSFNRTFSY